MTKSNAMDSDEKYSTLINNANAIRAICAAVESTLGPKGLDTMLVGPGGEVIITNDGVTILEKMDVSHPAARLLIQVARSQQELVGDGTTTATVLAGALVAEGAAQVAKGVPAAKVVRGMELGLARATAELQKRSRPVRGLSDAMLQRMAYIAGREHEDIARLVFDAAGALGERKLLEEGFRFADTVASHDRAASEVWPGLLLKAKPLADGAELELRDAPVLVLIDSLKAESVEEEALTTEAGFRRDLELKDQFQRDLQKLASLGVGLIATDRGVDAEAEQFCADHGIMVLQRVGRKELKQLCEFTGARPVKRTVLKKQENALSVYFGQAGYIGYDERLDRVRISYGRGKPTVTVLVGASTSEVVGERARIAKDAASALQAGIRGGYLPGGGSVEITVSQELERFRETFKGMESFGVAAVAQALRKPMSQIIINAGYNPLEKVEEIRAAQLARGSDSIGLDCDTGTLTDYLEEGVIDPTLVKLHALRAAGEVAAAILRIHTVIKMRDTAAEEDF